MFPSLPTLSNPNPVMSVEQVQKDLPALAIAGKWWPALE
jgi:hypothetical protein